MNNLFKCTYCSRFYSKIPEQKCGCGGSEFKEINPIDILNPYYRVYNISIEDIDKNVNVDIENNEIDNSCNFKHCKHFGKNPVYEPCCFCNLRRDLRNCYQEEE